MKKQSLLLIGGALLAFASCQQEATTGRYTQEQVDSMVNARVEEQLMALQASNDSTINALAQIKADSIIAAMKGGTAVTTKTTTTTTRNTTVNNGGATKPTPPKTVESGGLKSQSDQNRVNDKSSVQGGGLRSQSDQNKTNNPDKVERGGLKSQSDQNRR